MEGRVMRGRGGGWRRGGRGGHDGDGQSSEHRGRGRGGQHRSRGRRDHRGRGRGGGYHAAANFPQAHQDEGENLEDEDDRTAVFSRRTLESNWDRYEASERVEEDDGTPTQRGTDFHVLLESAGDSFTQFRFAEEKDWEMDPFAANQVSVVSLDLQALAQSLQQVPLHRRLNLEAELVQVSAPVELPAVSLAPKQEVPKFPPPSAAFKGLSASQKPAVGLNSRVSSVAVKPEEEEEEEDGDEELDELLGLQKSASSDDAGHQLICSPTEERRPPEEELEDAASEEKALDEDVAPPKPAEVKGSMTEEDLEDWLDSMIS
ncbi:cell death regulator Aven [Poeciliopsis prolifica]|uniref:cell death regulator Aven n=1 Tax=Poeciliopsis prolifica TaxID=188132 RepID=UPI002413286A|nr:cell death regulator Aven [Poeciliopsis prolifica]XP_054910435.1 cell death regulator Aven [Poeciliopsis prolifica]XP_054910436.1 cell death regulator Aven [Poeciliopsis prolifica]XP_054910437.1 cell death regulator Aven [Poeciliopsis prolifica]XP_054910438.1 cell death regulator Aven [Poeciliopsis prolifica]